MTKSELYTTLSSGTMMRELHLVMRLDHTDRNRFISDVVVTKSPTWIQSTINFLNHAECGDIVICGMNNDGVRVALNDALRLKEL